MNYTRRRGCNTGSLRAFSLVTIVLLCGAVPVPSFGNAMKSPADGGTRLLLFNLNAAASYSVVKNSAPLTTVNASRSGVAVFADVASVGDRYEISESGAGPEPPSAPTGVNAAGDDDRFPGSQ